MNNLPLLTNRLIALLYNPIAGKGKALKIVAAIEQKLNAGQIPFKPFSLDWPQELENFSEVWLVGGDGTLNHFINKYPGIQIPIALFKGGSGNDFAWKLYGTKSVDDYFESAINGITKRVDAGVCNGRYFLNGVGIGFDGEVVKAMGAKRFLSAGHMAYLAVVLRKILSYSEKIITLTWNDNKVVDSIFMVDIANGSRFGGGFLVAPQASIDDGQLDPVLIKRIPVFKRFFYLPKIEKGKHFALGFVEYSTCKKIIINSPEIVSAHLDGEFMEAKEFSIEIKEGKFLFYC